MRLDKYLSQLNMGSRSDVKNLIRQGRVTVNGIVVSSPDRKIDETQDCISCNGQILCYRPFVYYLLNKPQGVVSATTDKSEKTVLDLLRPFLPQQDQKREIVPVGRLDKDTEGLLLLTDDGEMVHDLLSPRKHVDKTYRVVCANPITPGDIAALEQGVDIGEKNKTLPARAVLGSEANLLYLTIHEGKFHQVKRMLEAVNNKVLSLKRIRFGPLELDNTLAPGACRELSDDEIERLKTCL